MSRNDWEALRDKGPQIEERERPRRKKSKKKLFAIEFRYCGRQTWVCVDWCVYRRYNTERQRDEALCNLNRKRSNWYEYRKQEPI